MKISDDISSASSASDNYYRNPARKIHRDQPMVDLQAWSGEQLVNRRYGPSSDCSDSYV